MALVLVETTGSGRALSVVKSSGHQQMDAASAIYVALPITQTKIGQYLPSLFARKKQLIVTNELF